MKTTGGAKKRVSSPAIAPKPDSCAITIGVFDGSRQPLAGAQQVLFTVRDGNQKQVYREFQQASSLTLKDLPFFDNFGDNYTIVAFADGYEQAGFTPVTTIPGVPVVADLMLLRKDSGFNFSQAVWETLELERPEMYSLLAAGAASRSAARNRYTDLMEGQAPALACFFNLMTAMSQIHLPSRTPVDYLKQLIWDGSMRQDRFFAWADPEIVNQVLRATAQKAFAPEPGTAAFHPGATSSFKQLQFGEADLQLTFHENDRKMVDGVNCIKVEPDIDYFKDPGAHTLLEVLPNTVGGGLTNPRQVYVLRWIAGRQARVPEFDPPYTIV
jgi:hypothetical protein